MNDTPKKKCSCGANMTPEGYIENGKMGLMYVCHSCGKQEVAELDNE